MIKGKPSINYIRQKHLCLLKAIKYKIFHVKTQPHVNHVQHFHKTIPNPRSKLPSFKADHITPDHVNCSSVFSKFTPEVRLAEEKKIKVDLAELIIVLFMYMTVKLLISLANTYTKCSCNVLGL